MEGAGYAPSPTVWGSLMVICGQQGHLEKAFSLWAEMQSRGVQPTVDNYHALMNACAATYQGCRAISLLQDMKDGGALCSASLCDQHHVSPFVAPRGEHLVPVEISPGNSSHREHSKRFLAGSIDVCGSKSDPPMHCSLKKCVSCAIGTAFVNLAGLEPNLVTYNIAIRNCGSPPGVKLSQRQLGLGLGLLAEMQASGIEPDVRTYTCLFVLCAQAEDGHRGWDLYQVCELHVKLRIAVCLWWVIEQSALDLEAASWC